MPIRLHRWHVLCQPLSLGHARNGGVNLPQGVDGLSDRRSKWTPIYIPEVAEEVETLVRREQYCCSFLQFRITRTSDYVELMITAPVGHCHVNYPAGKVA